MTKQEAPLGGIEVLDLYFLENRARLLEIASFLDRIDRAGAAAAAKDCRYRAFTKALLLLQEKSGRTTAVQLAFSDPSAEPLASAAGLKAIGAWDNREDH